MLFPFLCVIPARSGSGYGSIPTPDPHKIILDSSLVPHPQLGYLIQRLKKMALTANHVRVVQHGDAVMGERTQLVYDEEAGMVAQKKTMVAQVPIEGGGHAILVTEQMQVGQMVTYRTCKSIYHYYVCLV